jgi:hypothetical protein
MTLFDTTARTPAASFLKSIVIVFAITLAAGCGGGSGSSDDVAGPADPIGKPVQPGPGSGDNPGDPGDAPVIPGDDPVIPGNDPVIPGDDPVIPGDDPVIPGDDDPGDGDTGGGDAKPGDENPGTVAPLGVTTVTPATDAMAVKVDTVVRFTANTTLAPASVTAESFRVLDESGKPVAGTVRVEGEVASFTPAKPFASVSVYTAVITTAVRGIDGAALAEDFSWSFETAPTALEKAALPKELAKWETNMVTYGKKWGAFIGDSSNKTSQRRDAIYYDAQWVFQQIAEYTGQSEPWLTYARRAEQVYRDGYLAPNNFKVPGYWRFPHGLLGDYLAKDDTTRAQIRNIRDNPAFSNPDTNSYSWKWYHAMYAREVAYGLMAQVTAEKAGEPRRETRVQMFTAMMDNHLKQWRNGRYSDISFSGSNDHLQPFMFALVSQSLIEFYEWEKQNGRNPDAYIADIPGKLASFSRWMFNEAKVRTGAAKGKRLWIANIGGRSGSWNSNGGTGYGAFLYNDVNNPSLTPDLNLLIAPVYAWTYMMTGDAQLRKAADDIFASGAALAAVDWSGKIFNQNYRWSMHYVKWRIEGDQRWAK